MIEVFEDVAQQAYLRHASRLGLPNVEEWGRWQGRDRDRRDIEIDVVARLLDGRMMSGEVKFANRATGAGILSKHVDAVERLAASGEGWANEALEDDAVIYFVSASGFTDAFYDSAARRPQKIVAWTLDDLA